MNDLLPPKFAKNLPLVSLCSIAVFSRPDGTTLGGTDLGKYAVAHTLKVAVAAQAVEFVGHGTLRDAPLLTYLYGYSLGELLGQCLQEGQMQIFRLKRYHAVFQCINTRKRAV